MGALGSAALTWQAYPGDFKGERGSPVTGAGSGQAALGNTEEPHRPGRERGGRSSPPPPTGPQEAAGAEQCWAVGTGEARPGLPLLQALPIVPRRFFSRRFPLAGLARPQRGKE